MMICMLSRSSKAKTGSVLLRTSNVKLTLPGPVPQVGRDVSESGVPPELEVTL